MPWPRSIKNDPTDEMFIRRFQGQDKALDLVARHKEPPEDKNSMVIDCNLINRPLRGMGQVWTIVRHGVTGILLLHEPIDVQRSFTNGKRGPQPEW